MKNLEDTGIKKLIKLIKSKFESLAKVATSGSYNDLSGKPTIPSVGNGKITVKQGGTTKGTFTVNQTGATTIELTDNDTTYGVATASANGLMSSTDKSKLDNLQVGGRNLYTQNTTLSNLSTYSTIRRDTDINGFIVTCNSDGNAHPRIKNIIEGKTWYTVSAYIKADTSCTMAWDVCDYTLGSINITTEYQYFKGTVYNPRSDSPLYNFVDIEVFAQGANNKLYFKNFKVEKGTMATDWTPAPEDLAEKDHTHTKSQITDFPTSLKNPKGLRVQVNGDGASEVRYDGSEAKTINFVAGDNVTLTQKTSENKVTIAAKDTTYSAGTGLSLSGTTFKHSNSVTAGTAQGDASKTLTFGGTFTVPTVTYDAQGHVTGKGTTTMTMPANPNSDTKVTQAVTTINDEFPLLLAPNGQTTNATTTAYFDSGVTLNPSTNTIAANISGNAGTASKWATARNINGMSVQGDANRVNYGTCSTAAATAAKTVSCAGFELITGAEITVKFTVTNTATEPTLNVNGTGARPIQYRGSYILPSYLANGRVYTFRYDGTNYELVGDINTDTNTDTKVTQTLTSTDGSYPLLLAPKSQTATKTTTAYFDSGVTLNPSTNTIAANISGNAAKVANALTVKANGTQIYTYDGSVAKTINIKAGSNITITSDSSGNITISSTASAGSVTGDVGEVLYEKTSGGLYCDGKTYATEDNSCEIQDPNPNGYYKRFRFYCQGYYGLVCVDMPLDREHPAYITTNGTRYGGVIFPTAENGNINNNTGIGPSNHMYYELKWKVTRDLPIWRVQVIDSGWLGLNAGKTTNADYANNASTSNAGTGYVSWNQRHNNTYCIYKIVGYRT